MWNTLKNIGTAHRKKLLLTFSIVALENLLFLIYPVFGGFAVNAVMQGKVWQALTYALLVLLMWLVGAARRSADTRVFARIYSEIAVPVIVKQRIQGQTPSEIAARVALSREFVDFFEMHLPTGDHVAGVGIRRGFHAFDTGILGRRVESVGFGGIFDIAAGLFPRE